MTKKKCPECKGLGEYHKQDNYDGQIKVVTCPTCHGTGIKPPDREREEDENNKN